MEAAMKLKLRHSVPPRIGFCVVSLFAKVRFWPKTMDYSQAF